MISQHLFFARLTTSCIVVIVHQSLHHLIVKQRVRLSESIRLKVLFVQNIRIPDPESLSS